VGDRFGSSVAVSGSTVVVGAPFHASDTGRAYVFTKTSAGWDETELEGSGISAREFFAGPVAISGTTLVVCASSGGSFAGRAYVFTKTATGWRQSAELGGSPTGSFRESVAISGTTIVVGGADITDTGQAYAFTNTAKGWRQTAVLTGCQPAPADGFGESVAVSGTDLVVGAPDQGQSLSGAVDVFTQTAKGWRQTAELKGSDTVVRQRDCPFGHDACSGHLRS
jgi:FG-GAP repeat